MNLGPQDAEGKQRKEELGGRRLPGGMPAPRVAQAKRGFLVLCVLECDKGLPGILEPLFPKPLTPHPGQSHAGDSSWALLAVHWCPSVDRKQALISLPPEDFGPAVGEGSRNQHAAAAHAIAGESAWCTAPALSPP